MRKIIGIGETILDIVFRNNQPQEAVPGGSTFNSMISLGRMGESVEFLSELGEDQVGRQIRHFVRENGVSDRFLSSYPEVKSPISLAFLDEQQNANYLFYKEPFPENPDFDKPLIEADDIVLFGSYYALNPQNRYKMTELLDYAHRQKALIFYDVNFRKNHQSEAIRLTSTLIENLEYADIVRGSEEDFTLLYNLHDSGRVFKDKIEFYCPRLLYSRGEKGVELRTSTFCKDYPITPVKAVSTIGAGDNFNAGLVYGLLHQRIRRADLDELTERDWDAVIQCGLDFSAETCLHTDNYISKEFAAAYSLK